MAETDIHRQYDSGKNGSSFDENVRGACGDRSQAAERMQECMRWQMVNFHTESDMSTEEIMAYCNRYLPEDIAVVEVSEAAPRFHSRLNATGKRYRYRIINSQYPDVFWRRYATEEPEALDFGCYAKGSGAIAWRARFQGIYLCKKK